MDTSLVGKKIAKDSIKENFDFANYDLRGTDFSEINCSGSNLI